MKIIGITGKAGAGKDTVADYLVNYHGFVKYSLAEPIKQMLDVIGVDCRTRETKERAHPIFGVSPRRMAQTLGTEWMRDTICETGWLKLAAIFIARTRAKRRNIFGVNVGPEGIVIPDIRFDNEADWLRGQGGDVWHIVRDGIAPVEAHSSESGVAISATDEVIYNNGDLVDLVDAVDVLVRGEATWLAR